MPPAVLGGASTGGMGQLGNGLVTTPDFHGRCIDMCNDTRQNEDMNTTYKTQALSTFSIGDEVQTRHMFGEESAAIITQVINGGYLVRIGEIQVSRFADEVWAPMEHKTRTVRMNHTRQLNWRTVRQAEDQTSVAKCTCGWEYVADTREMARAMARQHRGV